MMADPEETAIGFASSFAGKLSDLGSEEMMVTKCLEHRLAVRED